MNLILGLLILALINSYSEGNKTYYDCITDYEHRQLFYFKPNYLNCTLDHESYHYENLNLTSNYVHGQDTKGKNHTLLISKNNIIVFDNVTFAPIYVYNRLNTSSLLRVNETFWNGIIIKNIPIFDNWYAERNETDKSQEYIHQIRLHSKIVSKSDPLNSALTNLSKIYVADNFRKIKEKSKLTETLISSYGNKLYKEYCKVFNEKLNKYERIKNINEKIVLIFNRENAIFDNNVNSTKIYECTNVTVEMDGSHYFQDKCYLDLPVKYKEKLYFVDSRGYIKNASIEQKCAKQHFISEKKYKNYLNSKSYFKMFQKFVLYFVLPFLIVVNITSLINMIIFILKE
uniref:Fam-e protein n=1 Tax=Parastrongyloides trichosuri TaxID=131310 RepID=A0A0N4ZVN4_PARTI